MKYERNLKYRDMPGNGLIINEIDQNEQDEYYLDIDEIEWILSSELDNQLAELKEVNKKKSQIGNPEALGQVVANVVWEQFINQVGVIAGEDFIKANRGLTLDLRNSAHIQTTENFARGKIAKHNTKIDYQKRYDDWLAKFEKDENGNIKTHTDRTGETVETVKSDARKPFDADRPKGSKENGTAIDHVVSAAERIRNAASNAHLTLEEQVQSANSDANLNEMDASQNSSKGDLSMTDWLDNPNSKGQRPNEIFDISEEQDREYREKDKKAREEWDEKVKEGEKRSIETGKQSQKEEAFRITGKALKAVVMGLLAELAKDIIRKLIAWFRSAERNFKTFIESVKKSVTEFVMNLKQHLITASDTLLTSIATAIFGPIISTLKKVWILLKQGYSSIKEAIDYINAPENADMPFDILMLEVGKIIVAGLTAGGALILSEVITKGLMTIPLFAIEIPLLGSLASVIGIFMGAVVSGIIGALVLNLIDRSVANIQLAAIQRQTDNLSTKIIATSSLHTLASAVKTGYHVGQTLEFTGQSIVDMGGKSQQIKKNLTETTDILNDADDRANRTSEMIGSLLAEEEENFEL